MKKHITEKQQQEIDFNKIRSKIGNYYPSEWNDNDPSKIDVYSMIDFLKTEWLNIHAYQEEEKTAAGSTEMEFKVSVFSLVQDDDVEFKSPILCNALWKACKFVLKEVFEDEGD